MTDELENAVSVDLPLRGEWFAYNTPARRIPSHGTDMLGQRYAYDLIRLDARRRYHPASTLRLVLRGVPTAECFGWGEQVHAPFDAEVVAASDGMPERGRLHPVLELLRVLRNAVTFRPTPGGLIRVLGNHVFLRGPEGYAAFAHLAPGSVTVAVGQAVNEGDVLGRVGHTGNSTAPHLHFQLMDGLDPRVARGVPCCFRRYELLTEQGWQLVERGIPDRTERIRSVSGA